MNSNKVKDYKITNAHQVQPHLLDESVTYWRIGTPCVLSVLSLKNPLNLHIPMFPFNKIYIPFVVCSHGLNSFLRSEHKMIGRLFRPFLMPPHFIGKITGVSCEGGYGWQVSAEKKQAAAKTADTEHAQEGHSIGTWLFRFWEKKKFLEFNISIMKVPTEYP